MAGVLGMVLAISGFLAMATTGLLLFTLGLGLVFAVVLLVVVLELTLSVTVGLLEVEGLV